MDLWVYPSKPKIPSWIWIRCIYSATYRNTFMSPLTFAMSTATRKFAQTFSYFIPGQPFFWRLSCLSPATTRTTHLELTTSLHVFNQQHDFAMTVAMQIPHRHQCALFHFNSAYLFWRHLFLTPKSTGLQTTRQMPAHHLLTVFFPLRRPAQRLPLNSGLYETSKLKNCWYLRSTHIFTLNITERVT